MNLMSMRSSVLTAIDRAKPYHVILAMAGPVCLAEPNLHDVLWRLDAYGHGTHKYGDGGNVM